MGDRTHNSTEEWRWVVGYEGYYEVSNLGLVRSAYRVIERSDGQRQTVTAKPISRHIRNGYWFVRLTRDGASVNFYVHRLVAFAFVGFPAPEQTEVCHNDGDRLNPAMTNLRWGTHAENMYDIVKHGTHRSPNREKTHCKNGHEFTPENTYRPPNKIERSCRVCRKARRALYYRTSRG